MTDTKNTEYITVNANGIFVGGKTTTTYRGEDICGMQDVKNMFAWMQEQNPEIEEFHIGAFETRGEHAKPGNPNGVFGPNAWCRVKYKNGNLGAWVFNYTSNSAAGCANYCAGNCAYYVRGDSAFRAAVFGATIKKQNVKPVTQPEAELKRKLQGTDLSKLVGKPVQLNGYKIIVEKIAETQQNKR